MKVYQKLMLGLCSIFAVVGVSGSLIYFKVRSFDEYNAQLQTIQGDQDNSLINTRLLQQILRLSIFFSQSGSVNPTEIRQLKQTFADFQADQKILLETCRQVLEVYLLAHDDYSENLRLSEHFTGEKLDFQCQNLEKISLEVNQELQPFFLTIEKEGTIGAAKRPSFVPKLLDFSHELIVTQQLFKAIEDQEFSDLERTLETMDDLTHSFSIMFLSEAIVFVIIYCLIFYQLLNSISKPIARLQVATQSVSDGSLDTIVAVDSNDEIGHLSMTFNTMIQRLKTSYEELQDKVKELEESKVDLTYAKDIAEEASRAKSVFLANMSHELRTPLNAIIGYSEMLQEEAEEIGEDSFVNDLSKIKSSGKHLLSLINDILDISKIEAGRMELYLENINVYNMVMDIVNTIAPLIEKNNNNLQVNCSHDIGEMKADVTKLRQNLFNILSNACKFTQNGLITITVMRKEKFIYFQIRDTGIGMTPDQLKKVFKPFTQADGSTTRKYGGTGLGLSITQHFCRMMGGDISVKSVVGQGSTFLMKFPVLVVPLDGESPFLEQNQHLGKTIATGKKVLIIDDDPDARTYMASMLNSWGFIIYQAGNGSDGLFLAQQHNPDAIMLDVMMPGVDGWSVLTDLKANPNLAHIPVIMTTLVNDQNLGYALGAADYIVKPIDRQQLLRTLKRLQIKAGASILIVEDDPSNREVLRRQLIKDGYLVEEASDGQHALELLSIIQPKLILLDLMMPKMDGFQLVDHLKQKPEWKSIPVVVLTAKDLDANDRQRLQGSVEKIYSKGNYNRKQFMEDIQQLLASMV